MGAIAGTRVKLVSITYWFFLLSHAPIWLHVALLLTLCFSVFGFIFGCTGSSLLHAVFSSCSKRGSSLQCAGFSLRWLLLLWSTSVRHTGFSSYGRWALERRLSSCGTSTWVLCSMWDPLRPGIEPVSPTLAGGFSSTGQPGKSLAFIFNCIKNYLSWLLGFGPSLKFCNTGKCLICLALVPALSCTSRLGLVLGLEGGTQSWAGVLQPTFMRPLPVALWLRLLWAQWPDSERGQPEQASKTFQSKAA